MGTSTEEKTSRTDLPTPGQALRDWDLMKETSASASHFKEDPFKIVSSKALNKKLMEDAGILPGPHGAGLQIPQDLHDPELPFGSRASWNRKKEFKEKVTRYLMALLGGSALVGPMILLTLHKSTLTSLLTVSLCVFVFAYLMAYYSDLKPFELLSTTAAYAAVLVVFVGTSS